MKQGCVLAPVLFNVCFSCMLSHATCGLNKGVYIRYRLDGSLFDLHRLTAKTKSKEMLLQEILFADDCALLAHTEYDIQMMMDSFSEASKLFGLTISLNKTEVLHQPAPNTHPHPALPSEMQSYQMLIILSIWEAQSPVMAPWTRRSPHGSARLAKHWADSGLEFLTNTIFGC